MLENGYYFDVREHFLCYHNEFMTLDSNVRPELR